MTFNTIYEVQDNLTTKVVDGLYGFQDKMNLIGVLNQANEHDFSMADLFSVIL
jgi:hypothetical protein